MTVPAVVPAATVVAAPTALPAVQPTAVPAVQPTAQATIVAAPVAAIPLVLSTREVIFAGPYTLQGTGTPGSIVELLVNGASIGTATVGADGRWSFDTTLAAGDNEILARAVDSSGAVLEGPSPADGFTWWRVRTVGGNEGWVAGENLVIQPD